MHSGKRPHSASLSSCLCHVIASFDSKAQCVRPLIVINLTLGLSSGKILYALSLGHAHIRFAGSRRLTDALFAGTRLKINPCNGLTVIGMSLVAGTHRKASIRVSAVASKQLDSAPKSKALQLHCNIDGWHRKRCGS